MRAWWIVCGLQGRNASVLNIPKKFSITALSYGFPRLDMDGVMLYLLVSFKYPVEVY